ncbi:MAG: efflux RND transporter permease subunit, partial [Deltaproteobacteria bacterium]
MRCDRHRAVEARQAALQAWAETSALTRTELRDTSIGIITSGIAYQYVREVAPDASVLKLGMVYPLPIEAIRAFAAQVETLYVVEELDPFIEDQLRAAGKSTREALLEAGPIRLRPILMTTVAMIAGMIPVALARGDGAETRVPMGVAIIGGLLTSTVLTLGIVPVVYSLLDEVQVRVAR